MSWECPDDWVHVPESQPASDGLLMAILFADRKRFKQIKAPWFRKCNASGKRIWPFQKAWHGVVAIRHGGLYSSAEGSKGSYKEVWLHNDQFVIQRLKGNI